MGTAATTVLGMAWRVLCGPPWDTHLREKCLWGTRSIAIQYFWTNVPFKLRDLWGSETMRRGRGLRHKYVLDGTQCCPSAG